MSGPHGSHWLEREDYGDVTVVRLKTPRILDDDVLRTVFDPIYSLVKDVGRKKLVLNLSAVGYLPSMAVGKLVMLNRKLMAENGRLALCHLSPVTEEILDGTRLKPLFNCYAAEAEAVQSFA